MEGEERKVLGEEVEWIRIDVHIVYVGSYAEEPIVSFGTLTPVF